MRKTNTLIFLSVALEQTEAGLWTPVIPFLVNFIINGKKVITNNY